MFDARAARRLAAGDHLIIDAAPGLRLEATQQYRTWIYRYRSPLDGGRMRQIKLGRWPAMGLPAAMAAWQAARDLRQSGGDPAAEKRRARAQHADAAAAQAYTVRAACDEWLQAYRGTVSERTRYEAQRTIDAGIGPLADRAADSITRADAFDLIQCASAHPVQASRLRRVLGAVWDRALDSGRLAPTVPNWWRLIMRGRLSSRGRVVGGQHVGMRRRALSEAELAQLIPWLPNFSRTVQDALTLMLWTACRGGEVVAMRADELSHERGVLWWTVPRAKLKMRRHPMSADLRVPLFGRAAEIVTRRARSSGPGYLFPSHGPAGHVRQQALGVSVYCHRPDCTIRPRWQRPRMPVCDWTPHDLRRTARTLLAAMGCPAEVGEAILGHLQPGIQAVYDVHGYDAQRVEWLSKLDQKLESCVRRPASLSLSS